jgi:hypothetical protein
MKRPLLLALLLLSSLPALAEQVDLPAVAMIMVCPAGQLECPISTQNFSISVYLDAKSETYSEGSWSQTVSHSGTSFTTSIKLSLWKEGDGSVKHYHFLASHQTGDHPPVTTEMHVEGNHLEMLDELMFRGESVVADGKWVTPLLYFPNRQ